MSNAPMRSRPIRLGLVIAVLAVALAGRSIPCRAQDAVSADPGEGSGSTNLPHAGTTLDNGPQPGDPPDTPPGGDDPGAKSASPPPPPALPGSHAEPASVAPADRNSGDMEPTTALFDAINRGDTVAARDAISRGANLDGHNVLGLTPIELSVDLGRNDISFLLLSMHSEAADPGTAPVVQAAAASTPPSPHGRHALAAARKGATVSPVTSVAGAPVAATGFLGFGKSGS